MFLHLEGRKCKPASLGLLAGVVLFFHVSCCVTSQCPVKDGVDLRVMYFSPSWGVLKRWKKDLVLLFLGSCYVGCMQVTLKSIYSVLHYRVPVILEYSLENTFFYA